MALGCETDAEAWRLARPLPVTWGHQNVWLVRVRAPEGATPEELLALVRDAFSRWLPLFPAGAQVGLPYLYSKSFRLPPVHAELDAPAEYFRGPSHDVPIKFSLGDSAAPGTIGWPTLTANRRARKDALCPDSPIDTAPVVVYETLGPALLVGPTVEAPENPNAPDPLDLGLPPIDPDALTSEVKKHLARIERTAWALAAVVVGALGLRELVRRRK